VDVFPLPRPRCGSDQAVGARAARCRPAAARFNVSTTATSASMGHGVAGAVRGRAWVTTTQSEPARDRPRDLVDRAVMATRPNQLWVSDFTYVATGAGFVYVAFVVDV